jgi:hypothetical protein
MARIVYQGDVNLEHGGVFFKLDRKDWDEYGYASAVRVTPCSDAGAQDNAFWIEELTINKPEGECLKEALKCCGWHLGEGDVISADHSSFGADPGTDTYRLIIMEACVSYGYYDKLQGETVQIGKKADSGSEADVEPDTVLRANASLEHYVRREWVRSL